MSSLQIGIVGLPNVGKSTLFRALTHNDALIANYPFATIDPNVGVVSVPDERLERIGSLYPGAPLVPTTVAFTDIAGLVAGASQGEGLGNQFLANIREVSAIVHVVRAFDDPNVQHVNTEPDPQRDIETIHTELILADIATLQKRTATLDKPARSNPGAKRDLQFLQELLDALNQGRLLIQHLQGEVPTRLERAQTSEETNTLVRQLLTTKPIIFVFNVDESALRDPQRQEALGKIAGPHEYVCICAQLEAELVGLTEAEAHELLHEYGQEESGLVRLIHSGYRALGLQSFFTAGEKEVRAWTIPVGATAPQAAGAIHSDFERGFIAAETVDWHDLLDTGSRPQAKRQGKLRTEGKDYVMQDGDVVEFRFNV